MQRGITLTFKLRNKINTFIDINKRRIKEIFLKTKKVFVFWLENTLQIEDNGADDAKFKGIAFFSKI